MSAEDTAGLTQRDILIRLDGKVDGLLTAMAIVQTNADAVKTTIDDHETRIRDLEERMPDEAKPRLARLERFRNAVPSVALLSLIVSIALLAYYISTSTHG